MALSLCMGDTRAGFTWRLLSLRSCFYRSTPQDTKRNRAHPLFPPMANGDRTAWISWVWANAMGPNEAYLAAADMMQYRLLDLICCPSCKSDVALEVFKTTQRPALASLEGKRCRGRCAYVDAGLGVEPDCLTCSKIEVEEGTIQCGCGKVYPIIGGVARFLPEDLQAELVDRYPQFFRSHGEKIQQQFPDVQRDKVSKLKAQTISAFGYEWTQFADYDAQNFLELIYPVQPEYFRGKLGLDCGWAAEVAQRLQKR